MATPVYWQCGLLHLDARCSVVSAMRPQQLLYYISLLEKRQAEVVRMVYMEGVSTKKAAEQHGLTVRTIERIRKDAVDNLAEMYAYSERYNG